MLGFLQTIINAIESLYNTFSDLIDNAVYYIGILLDLVKTWYDVAQNAIPLPLQAVTGVVLGIVLTRLVISLGRR